MRRLLPTLLLSAIAIAASAELPTTGYYRVQNQTTTRYVYVRDNKGRIDVGATTADYDAIWLIKDDERPHYDASGIIYLNRRSANGNEYDLEAQGTSVHELISMYPSIYEITPGTFRIGGTSNGLTKFLSDGEANLDVERSFLRDAGGASAQTRQQWSVFPVADSYFGIIPAVSSAATGKGYATFYADFPYATLSQGMKLYAVVKVGDGQAALREVEGIIPNATPLVIEVSGSTASDNRLDIGGTATATAPADNMLVGVYFNNTYSRSHWNVVEYDPATMRVLGLTSDGQPGFITAGSDLKYIAANTAYLSVPAGTDAELRLVSEDEFSSINEVSADRKLKVAVHGLTVTVSGASRVEIVNLAGRTVANATVSTGAATFTLPAHGIYLLRTPGAVSKLTL